MAYHLGVDTGGTFTDFVVFNVESGDRVSFKVPSVPRDPAMAVANGLAQLERRFGIAPAAIERFVFGTTVATNAILERKGAATALLATQGTRDVLEIQRQWRQRLFDLYLQKPDYLVPRRHRIDVRERVSAQGEVLVSLTDAEIDRISRRVTKLPVEALAICFLFSFLNPEHERRLRDGIKKRAPKLHVSISSDICPEFREFERACTTVINSYVMPKVHALIAKLGRVIADADCRASFRVMQSNGGLMNAEKTASHPVHTLLSGPAGGVVSASALAVAAGYPNVITMDMGGTSLDVCLVDGGRTKLFSQGSLGGLPIKVPQIDIHTLGAGGGTIAGVFGGALKVGPKSAGADPGPASYGRGGTEPTSTDAALTLGYIDPAYFLGGEMSLDPDAARTTIRRKIAEPLDLTEEDAAYAIVHVQVVNIVGGIRVVSVEKGVDPREFALLPFGGAGGLYAGLIAEEMGIKKIVVPAELSVLSALGLLMANVKYTDVATRILPVEGADPKLLNRTFEDLAERVKADMASERLPAESVAFERSCDMRYVGQAFEVNVPLENGRKLDAPGLAALMERFHQEHRRLYGQSAEKEPVEFVNFRVTALGHAPKIPIKEIGTAATDPPKPKGERRAYFGKERGWQRCPIFERARLGPGVTTRGPAMIEDVGASIVIYPGHTMSVDRFGNLIIDLP
jgi:N-methylhydantoinase A